VVDGRYRLGGQLGAGAMGEVWAAEHVALRRPVALKVLRRGALATERQRRRFQREARLVASIEHPSVIEISDFGELPEGVPFLTMKRLDGRTLDRVLAEDGAMPWPRAVSMLRQLADALAEVHRHGVIHRDLKPANIFVSPAEPERVTILDFGIAGRTTYDPKTAKLTKTGSVFGSPGYMAPEQIRGEQAGVAADIYALGCIGFELLTGRRLFEGDQFERMRAHLFDPLPPLPESVPSGVSRAILRCLAKAPDERLASMGAVLEMLEGTGGSSRSTLAVEGYVPAVPPGAPTEARRATVPGRAMADTELLPVTPEPRRPGPRWMVAAVSAGAGLAVLAALFVAQRGREPASEVQPEAAPVGPGVEPPVPDAEAEHVGPTAAVAQPQPSPTVEEVDPAPRAEPEPEVEVAPPAAADPPTSKPRRARKSRPRVPEPSSEAQPATPKLREDGTYDDIFESAG